MIYKMPASVFPVRESLANKKSERPSIDINKLARVSGLAKLIIKNINSHRLNFNEGALPDADFKFSLQKNGNTMRIVVKYWLPSRHIETSRVFPVATIQDNGRIRFSQFIGFDSVGRLSKAQKMHLESAINKLFLSSKTSANENTIRKLHEPMIFPDQRVLKKVA